MTPIDSTTTPLAPATATDPDAPLEGAAGVVGPPARVLGLPSVTRLATFARAEGPAVLLTTSERLPLYDATHVFEAQRSIDPGLGEWHERHDKVVVSLAHALAAFPRAPEAYALDLVKGGSYARDALLERLLSYGFERDELPGITVRGDTVTLHLGEDDEEGALRLEFFGDELDALFLRGKAVEAYVLAPRTLEHLERDAWTTRVLEHLPGTVYLDAPELYAGSAGESDLAWLWQHLAGRAVVSFGRDPLALPDERARIEPLGYYRGKLATFAEDVHMWLKDGYSVQVLLKFERTGRYLRERVLDQVATHWRNRVEAHPGEVSLVLARDVQGGHRDPDRMEVVLTEELLYGYQGGRKLAKLPGKRVHDASQLTVGDYLIHPDHGIGRFLGLEPRTVVGVVRDYLLLQYAGEGRLYLPVEQLPLLRRHPGTTDDPPRLSTLGTNEWARAREKARASAEVLAAELIKTYAQRQVSQGTSFPPQPEWDELIEQNCPFVLTPDQRTAVADVLADMERPVPMDRLISGDVGFGKTEVAVRATHRAVGNGGQVAVLVPTTVLAKQHYDTFRQRFDGLPVRVEMLSRFSSDKDARATLKGLADGTVDVVVGTHRLLNESIAYKNLGLLVVDEEHRFGVGQKERLKGLKANLDVVSLSATPIPRTLYMSLVGLRDVSQIMTPPEGRKPIQTVLQPYDPMVVREAVLAELERGGKTFYIHDRIGSMSLRARTLAQLVPEARVGVAHGQMNADDLEQIMLGFEEGAFDVLLSTTIVESGLDIQGANTLVIERADRLGLAQLYQLRGRVGRRQTEAWAYMLYPGRLTEQAQRRLYAIAELNDLGSGHLLAEKDMEIRGVGNLLGPEQHGHISAVSLEVYTEMLAEEIAKLKGEEKAKDRPHVTIDLSIDARLSPTYVQDDDVRINYYGRLSEADGLAEVNRIAKEMREAYGPFPPEVKAFVDLTRLRLLAGAKGVAAIKEHMTDVQVAFERDLDAIDYDAKTLKSMSFAVEPTRYPPGFSIKKRGQKTGDLPGAVMEVLYLVG
ncbi:MAG: transcription-repair coupling factor [Trueperaceae bacterium]